MSNTLLTRLDEMMAKVSPEELLTTAADDKIEEGEVVIGDVPDDLLRLYAVFGQLTRKCERMVNDHKAVCKQDDGPECRKALKKVYPYMILAELAKDLFFATLRDMAGAPNDTIGVRRNGEGVKVVRVPKKPEQRPRLDGIIIIGR